MDLSILEFFFYKVHFKGIEEQTILISPFYFVNTIYFWHWWKIQTSSPMTRRRLQFLSTYKEERGLNFFKRKKSWYYPNKPKQNSRAFGFKHTHTNFCEWYIPYWNSVVVVVVVVVVAVVSIDKYQPPLHATTLIVWAILESSSLLG